jgi:hypothetical protein
MMRRLPLVAAVYAALGLLYTWPLALHPAARLAAPVGPGDPFLNLWILGWDLRTLEAHPLALLTGRIFQAPIFHPADLTLAYSDHLILQSVALLPLHLLGPGLVACYNLLLAGSLVAAAWSMYAFALAVSGSRRGAFVAGLAWGFGPYHFAHLLHLQLQALYLLPLAFLFLHRLLAARRRRDAIGLGVCVGVQAASAVYYGVIGTVAVAASLAVLAAVTGQWRSRVLAGRLALSGVVALAIAVPFAWPYWQVQRQEGFARNLYEASRHAAGARSYLQAPPGNVLYGRTGLLREQARAAEAAPAGEPGRSGPERELFPGFVLAALAGLGFWRSRRGSRRAVAWSLAAVGAVGFVLSLGPDGIRPFYATVHGLVFGFQAIRAPARFGVLVLFALASLAALGIGLLDDRAAARPGGPSAFGRVLAPFLVLAVALECLNVPLPVVAVPPLRTEVGAWLRQAPEPGAVVYLPLELDAGNTPHMLQALEHGRPIVNGYSGQRPPFFVPVVESLQAFPSAESLWVLRDLGVRFVVAPSPVAGAAPLVERARVGGRVIYELRWTPEAEAAAPRPHAPPPPPPGPVPFAPGESAAYQVTWEGSGLPLSAGDAVFRVRDRAAGSAEGSPTAPGFLFDLRIETAAWVARFFEARDTFETWADNDLLPVEQHQHLREGQRVLDKAARFDPAAQVVESAGVTLPTAPGSRDALSAFYYARTLALPDGATVRVPVNEGGRNLVVEITNRGRTSLPRDGRGAEVFRLEARVQQRLERRRPIEATVWLSADARRIPLAIDVTTAFGTFRAELKDYRSR